MTVSDLPQCYGPTTVPRARAVRAGDGLDAFLATTPARLAYEVDAHALLNEALRRCRKKIEAKRLHVSLRLLARRYQVFTDPERLHRVFLNLLSTVIERTECDGTFTIRSSCPGDGSLRVEVEERSARRVAPQAARSTPTSGD
jgi:signal transduction histidine kinase